jgi:hypothetical protein
MEPIEKTVEKIRKCLRLAARSAEDGERAAARNRAEALASAAGLDIEELCDDMPCPVEECDEMHRTTGNEQDLALALVRDHFGVVAYWNVNSFRRTRGVAWIGERANIPVARQIYIVATRAARRAWQARREEGRRKERVQLEIARRFRAHGFTPPRFKKDAAFCPGGRHDFMRGFFAALDATLRAHPLRADRDALVRERAAAQRRLDGESDIEKKKSRTIASNFDAQLAGFRSGERVALSRPVAGTAAPLRLASC